MVDYLRDNNSKNNEVTIKVTLGAVAALATAVTLYDYFKDQRSDPSNFMSSLHPNELFCENPNLSNDFMGDPFISLNTGWIEKISDNSRIYDHFWQAASGAGDHETINFDFDDRMYTTSHRSGFFDKIPQHIIDDPNVNFILSGHATDDLKHYFALGVPLEDGFMERYTQHLKNNHKAVELRLDFIEAKLIEAGIPEDRIIRNNLNTRHNKRAVDLEVCAPSVESS